MTLLVLLRDAHAQSCTRYQDFEGKWDGWITSENIEHRYPNAMLAVPDQFNPDHRLLDITWRNTFYEVAWNLVQGQNVPSLREVAQIAPDADGYCRQVRTQSHLPPDMQGLRINIDGSYNNGAAVVVKFQTRTCCFLYRPQEMSCVGATQYRTQAYEEEHPWYNGVWYATMARQPRPNDCEGS
jgi:hypothetical protein